jgi:hypothetical protein
MLYIRADGSPFGLVGYDVLDSRMSDNRSSRCLDRGYKLAFSEGNNIYGGIPGGHAI